MKCSLNLALNYPNVNIFPDSPTSILNFLRRWKAKCSLVIIDTVEFVIWSGLLILASENENKFPYVTKIDFVCFHLVSSELLWGVESYGDACEFASIFDVCWIRFKCGYQKKLYIHFQ